MSTKTIVAQVDSFLRPLGFRRQRMVWNRKSNLFVDVVDVQISKSGDTLTINAGVLHPHVYAKCWGREPSIFVEEPSCTVRARIGQLIDGRDRWWHRDDSKAAEDIGEKVRSYVLPFIERMHSVPAMTQFLEDAQVAAQQYPPPIIYLALLKSEQGDRSAACDLLRGFEAKVLGRWKSRVSKVIEELGCP